MEAWRRGGGHPAISRHHPSPTPAGAGAQLGDVANGALSPIIATFPIGPRPSPGWCWGGVGAGRGGNDLQYVSPRRRGSRLGSRLRGRTRGRGLSYVSHPGGGRGQLGDVANGALPPYYCHLSNWAPAFAGVVLGWCGGGSGSGNDLQHVSPRRRGGQGGLLPLRENKEGGAAVRNTGAPSVLSSRVDQPSVRGRPSGLSCLTALGSSASGRSW
ncbi:hypothetical protein QFZ54_001414 [Sphingomonas faeni]|nr:hypothetical protein [Sphingomonas faeni]